MPRIRLTIRHNPNDPADDLRYAARVRRDLWAHSPVEIDPDSRVHGTHRDAGRNAYFEFATEMPDEVARVLREYGHNDRVTLSSVQVPAGEACQNCGNIAGPVLPTVCPTCHHRDIDPCPNCDEEVPRQEYERSPATSFAVRVAVDVFDSVSIRTFGEATEHSMNQLLLRKTPKSEVLWKSAPKDTY